MKVDFFIEGEEDPVGSGDWPTVPEVGEPFSFGEGDYTVESRSWGTHVKGDGSPLWNQPYCAVTLVKSSTITTPPSTTDH